MTTITTINGWDDIKDSRTVINTNFDNLNADKAEKTNVLELDNTDIFTPDADYEPATKKYVDDNSSAEAVVINAKVNEAGGITAGQIVYITWATWGFPQVALADNTDFSKADTLAIASETKTDGQSITVIVSWLLTGVDTSAFTEWDILYLGTTGDSTATHPTGINAVQRIGHAVKINASTGSILVELDQLSTVNNHNWTVRRQLVNSNTWTIAGTAYTLVNDAGHLSSFSLTGSNFSPAFPAGDGTEALTLYNEWYGDAYFTNDGNKGFFWLTDTTDSHNFSSTPKMTLTADGKLGIGTTTPLDTLDVIGDVMIDHTAAWTDEHALEIDVHAGWFWDVKAIDIDYITGAIWAWEDEWVILVNIDETSAAGWEVFALEVLTTTLGSDKVIAVKTGVGIDAISQDSGTFWDADSILNIAVDVTAALADWGAGNITIFVADNDTITIGDAAKFDEMEVILDTGASGSGVAPTFEYSTWVGTWAAFTPTDGTNGFRNTGAMLWDSTDLAGWVVGTGSEFLIRITRTRNSLATTPIVDEIQIVLATVYSWDKDGDVVANSFAWDGSLLTNLPAWGGAWTLVSYTTTSATTVNLTSLDLDTDSEYRIIVKANWTVWNSEFRFVLNNDTSKYYVKWDWTSAWVRSNTSVVALSNDTSWIWRYHYAEINLTKESWVFPLIKFESGGTTSATGTPYSIHWTWSYNSTVNVTQVNITTSSSSDWDIWVLKPNKS